MAHFAVQPLSCVKIYRTKRHWVEMVLERASFFSRNGKFEVGCGFTDHAELALSGSSGREKTLSKPS